MKTFAGFQEWHSAKLDEFSNESTPDPMRLREIVAELGVLPLMLDIGGGYAIRPNGEVISFLWDNEKELRLENDPRILNIAIFQGSKKYPELKALIPPKPNDAIECPGCNGSGVAPQAAELKLDNLVCYCGGLGWIPPEEREKNS